MKKYTFLLFAIVSLAGMLAISGCKKETYTVTFFPNGGNGFMSPQTFTEGKSQVLDINTFTRDGYSFAGWNTTPAGIGVGYTDGQEITVTADMMLYAMWQGNGGSGSGSGSGSGGGQSGLIEGQLNGHAWVDLGLPSGTKWATCNIGATTPEAYGDYFSWGETTPKNDYSSGTYTFSGYPTTLPASADAATVNWGAGWRMPTYDEMNELNENCTVTWTTQNSINGRLFTGPNGKSIFLPAAGYRYSDGGDEENDDLGTDGEYWTSSLRTDLDNPLGWSLWFYNGNSQMWSTFRNFGLTVRPVCASAQN